MREIKFRAWDKRNNMMVDLGHVVIDRKSKYNAYAVLGGLTHGNDYELMQYTGIKCRLHEPIFEGDILEDEDGDRYTVCWDNYGQWWAEQINDNSWSMSLGEVAPESVVIGNIHENPELLERKE